MHLVARWVRDGDPQEPESILMAADARRLAADLSELRSGRTPQTAASVRLLMREAISLHA
jgi:hypothetical protein